MKKLRNIMLTFVAVLSLFLINVTGASAEWKQDSTGWLNDDGSWYYLKADGRMVHDCTIDGCYINSLGIWVQQNNNSAVNNTSNVTAELKVHFIDVGQADSILIQQGNENMLINTGNNDDENTLKNYLAGPGVKELNYAIATHPHEDHIGSMDYIMNSLKVGQIYAPNSSSYDDLNDYSIVVKVEFGNNSFLFTGDVGEVSEKEILSKGLDLKADVLKVGHHGSRTSSSDAFLNAVKPKYAVISVGKNNDYGHPHKESLQRLSGRGIQVYRTDESGTIVATSYGSNIKFKYNPATGSTNVTYTTNSNNSSVINTQNDNNGTTINQLEDKNRTVYASRNNGKVYHYDKTCSGLKNPN